MGADGNSKQPAAQRLESLDALRGLDMLCIIGLDALVYAIYAVAPGDTTRMLAAQFGHKDWSGLALYDLIFPLFVFISGVAMAFRSRPSAPAA